MDILKSVFLYRCQNADKCFQIFFIIGLFLRKVKVRDFSLIRGGKITSNLPPWKGQPFCIILARYPKIGKMLETIDFLLLTIDVACDHVRKKNLPRRGRKGLMNSGSCVRACARGWVTQFSRN